MKSRLFFPTSCFFLLLATIFLVSNNSCSSSKTARTAGSVNIEPRSSWQAIEAKPFKKQVPVRITVHHEGTKLEIADDAAKKINAIQRWGMGPDKKWADIPYHFLIAPDGRIYEGRDPFTVGETSTEYNPEGHLLICCLGNRETDTVPAAQLRSLIKLVSFSARKFNIPLDSLRTHKDYSAQTTCPGRYLTAFFENGYIRKELKKMQ